MAGEIEFKDEGIQQFLDQISNRIAQIENGEKVYGGILSSIVFRDIMKHFEEEMGSDGKWEHWSFWHTVQMERQGKGGNKILQDTGRLRQSFKPHNWRKIDEGFLWFNNAQTKSGFPYAWAHDTGTEKLPKRDFMWASNDALETIMEQTLNFITEEE